MKQHILLILSLLFSLSSCGNYEATLQNDTIFKKMSTTNNSTNKMIDTFKDYAKEVSYKAILADSGMMIMSCLIASYLVNKNTNTNIIVLISFLYLLPYLLYN